MMYGAFSIKTLRGVLLLAMGLVSISCGEKEDVQKKITQLEAEIKSLQSQLMTAGKDAGEKSVSVVTVVNKVVPSVVSIHSEKIIEVQPHQYFNPFEDFFFGPDRRQQQRPPQKRRQQGLGSGVIFTKEGHILSNHHVVGEADELRVTLSDDREFEAEIVGTDNLSDVAVIKIKNPPKDLPVVEMGDSEALQVGETVIAIGNPFGYSNTVTSGILSAKGRQVGINSYENYLQTDASINPGNSGGALVNLKGELVGINTAIASRTGASHGIGFAIPINMAKSIMEDLIGNGSVTRGYLGVYLQEVDMNLAKALGLKQATGALVTSVIEDSPAEKAEFHEMDLILKVDGKEIKNVNHLRNIVAMLEPDKSYSFEVLRDKKKVKLKVKIGVRETEKLAKGKEDKSSQNYGLTLENITRQHAYRYNLSRQSGVLIMDVEMGSSGEEAGLKPGDVIVSVNKKKVRNVNEFKKLVKNAKSESVLILVDRQGTNLFIGLKIK